MTFEPKPISKREPGDRVSIGPEFEELILKYGQPGVIRGEDAQGVAYQEARAFDFNDWPDDMPEAEQRELRKIVHCPEWVLISANGMKAVQPLTGKWVRAGEPDFERLSRMNVHGEIKA